MRVGTGCFVFVLFFVFFNFYVNFIFYFVNFIFFILLILFFFILLILFFIMLICFFCFVFVGSLVSLLLSLSLSLSMGAPGKLMNRLTGYGGRIHLHCHAMLHKLTKEQGGGRHLIIVKRPRMQDLKLHLIIVKRPRIQDLNASLLILICSTKHLHTQSSSEKFLVGSLQRQSRCRSLRAKSHSLKA